MNTEILVGILFLALAVIAACLRSPKAKGARGEKQVAEFLKQLPSSRYTVYHNLLLQEEGHSSQIDHVVLSPYGIFVIETKNYGGWIFGGEYSEHWTQNLYGKRYDMPNPIRQNTGHIWALQRVLRQNELSFISIVAFSDKAELKVDAQYARVVHYRQIVEVIRQYRTQLFDAEMLEEMQRRMQAVPEATKEDLQKHVRRIRESERKRRQDVAAGRCPKCGGQLVKRKGKYGVFYGCSNFPRCRFTCKSR